MIRAAATFPNLAGADKPTRMAEVTRPPRDVSVSAREGASSPELASARDRCNRSSPAAPHRGWLSILRSTAYRVYADQIGLISAGVAYYALLAIVPAIAALIALGGLFVDPESIVAQLQPIGSLMPPSAASIVIGQAEKLAQASRSGLTLTLVFGTLFALYLAANATTSLIYGLNVAWRVKEERGMIRYWTAVFLISGAALLGSFLALVLLVGLPAFLALVPVPFGAQILLNATRWIALTVAFLTGLAMLYRWGPSGRPCRMGLVTPGIFVAGLLWFAGSAGFSLYVTNFAHYNQTFGSLGGVIVLLTWLWLSAYVVLLGAVLDAETCAFRKRAEDGQHDAPE